MKYDTVLLVYASYKKHLSTVYSLQLHFTVHSLQFTVYSLQFTVYSFQFTV